jgi:hypothetical protein
MDGTANEHPHAKVCITAFDGWFWLIMHFLENGLLPFIFIFFKTYYSISMLL